MVAFKVPGRVYLMWFFSLNGEYPESQIRQFFRPYDALYGLNYGLKNQVTLHNPGFHRVNIVNTILNFYGLIC